MSHKITSGITELGGLLSAVHREFNSQKTGAVVRITPPTTCEVEMYFDSGIGHSSAFSSERFLVDYSVFEEAKAKRYIVGKKEWGHTSDREFVVTDNEDLFPEMDAIRHPWEEKDWLEQRKNYILKNVPPDYRGIHFNQALRDMVEAKGPHPTELSFAEAWARFNHPTQVERTVIHKLITPPEADPQKNAYAELLPIKQEEWEKIHILLATLVQWFGTEEGKSFYVHSMLMGGTRVHFEKAN